MPATEGPLSTFGDSLQSQNFWGASSINPNGMQNNCVSVATARLHYYPTVEALWQDIYGQPLPDNPLSFSQIVDILGRTGWTYRWKACSADANSNKTAYQTTLETFAQSTQNQIEGIPANAIPAMCLYTWKVGNQTGGHAVNMNYKWDLKTNVTTYF